MRASVIIVLACVFAVGCKKEQPKPPTGTIPTTGAAQPTAAGDLRGKVAEKIDAAGYSYLRVTTDKGDVWAAVPVTAVGVGADVTITNPMPMPNFESKTLNRKFDMVMFGSGAQVAGEAAPPTAGGQPANPHTSGASAAAVPTDVKTDKAPGPDGRTVAEIFAQKAALKDKSVDVKGKVVKFTPGVLGRNWIHLRDGSGTDEAKDNDITVTTQDNAGVGDVVVVKGTVHLDKDLGAGYAYSVIIEDAKVSAK